MHHVPIGASGSSQISARLSWRARARPLQRGRKVLVIRCVPPGNRLPIGKGGGGEFKFHGSSVGWGIFRFAGRLKTGQQRRGEKHFDSRAHTRTLLPRARLQSENFARFTPTGSRRRVRFKREFALLPLEIKRIARAQFALFSRTGGIPPFAHSWHGGDWKASKQSGNSKRRRILPAAPRVLSRGSTVRKKEYSVVLLNVSPAVEQWRENWMVDRVGIMLRFQAETARIAGVELHSGFGGAQFHHPAALWIPHPRGQDQGLAASVDDEVVVVHAGLGLELPARDPISAGTVKSSGVPVTLAISPVGINRSSATV